MERQHCIMLPNLVTSSVSQYLQVICARDGFGATVLHRVARSDNLEAIKFLLNLWPESQRSQAVNMKDGWGCTVLQLVPSSATRKSIEEFIDKPDDSYRGLVRLPCLSHSTSQCLVSPQCFSNKRRRISDRKKAPENKCHKPNQRQQTKSEPNQDRCCII